MILVDTMVWADHLGHAEPDLASLLNVRGVVMHAMVIGELALGNLPDRRRTLASFSLLPAATVARHAEVMDLIEKAQLFGTGIGYVDVHLLASTLLTPRAQLWTRDKRLRTVADRLSIKCELD